MAEESVVAERHGEMFEAVRARDYSNDVRLDKLEKLFTDLLPFFKHIQDTESEDVRSMFQASDMLFRYAEVYSDPNPESYLKRMEAAFKELRRRGLATGKDDLLMFSAYLAAWDTDKAKLLKKSSSYLSDEIVPITIIDDVLEENIPAHMVVSETGDFVTLRNVDMGISNRIVIVSGCHVSKKAAMAISSNDVLRKAFSRGNAIWLAPAGSNFDLRAIQNWNREFPGQQMSVAYRNSAWKDIDFSGIPAFYFFKDGKLLAEHNGWPRDGVPSEIIEVLRSMQLLPETEAITVRGDK